MPFNNLSYQNKHTTIHTIFKCSLYYHIMVKYSQDSKNKQICTQVACKRLDYVMQFPCVATCSTFPCINERSTLWQCEWTNYNVELWRQQCKTGTGDAWGQRLKGFEALTIGYYYTFVFCSFNDTINNSVIRRLTFWRLWRLLYVPPGLTFKNSTWRSLCVECFVRVSEQTATFALYVFNWQVFIIVVGSVYCAVRSDSLYKADYVSYLKG